MTTLLAGLGPAGRGVLAAALASGAAAGLCRSGLLLVDPDPSPGGGMLHHYGVRSDSAAAVFAQCVADYAGRPGLRGSLALAAVQALPDGESVALPVVGRLLQDATGPLLQDLRALGADVRLGTRVVAAVPRRGGGAGVFLRDSDGRTAEVVVESLLLAVGGVPSVPPALAGAAGGRLVHSEDVLRPDRLAGVLDRLPPDPRVLVVGRAHSAFSACDRLLSSAASRRWSDGAVRVAARGRVRVTYPDRAAAFADGAVFDEDAVCPESGRVWRLCGLRGDAATRYRLARDGRDPRLVVEVLDGSRMLRAAAAADLVVAATGYRSGALALVRGAVGTLPDGSLVDAGGDVVRGVRTIGLGSGSRRTGTAGEPAYTGPVDGVWHYQTHLAPVVLDGLRRDAEGDGLDELDGLDVSGPGAPAAARGGRTQARAAG